MRSSTTTSQHDTEMTTSADESNRGATPPARLAARFYRKSSSRRRSSAHSSRRSSLSSIHSHHSALSCHGGPHSTHIAQHLRRASIIESRKARLADRAAHAEQVRLRAAAAKATPRTTYSEERALAAQAAREKLLAEITARCEEEVRRAKKIAEETKEKKAAEHARLEEEMTRKFADAARRKSIYQSRLRRPRTTSLAAVEETKINPVVLKRLGQTAAAKIIQRAWRNHHSRQTFVNFLSLQLSVERLSNLPFEDVTRVVSEERTMEVTGALLTHLGMVEAEQEQNNDRGAVRVFLSAFVILAHPIQALSHGGKEPQEQELQTKARALLESFEGHVQRRISITSRGASKESSDDLLFVHNDYSQAFHAWKSQDSGVLIDVMVNSFVNLDLIIQATKDDHDGMVADDYLQAVRQEQVKLLVRLKRLAGPDEALARVRKAVQKARKQRALKQKKAEEHVPRATTPVEDKMETQTPLTPPATPMPQRSLPESLPSSFVNKLGQTMTVLPSNREIAHEMQINGTYEVQQQPWTDSRKHFMDSLRSSMRESMKDGGNQTAASWTHAMAVLIRDKLLNLISDRHPLHDRIDDFLDPKLIEQQCRNGMFSYESFFDTIANLVAQVCSPGRDEAVKAFASDTTSDTIDRLFALINIVDLMTLDHINFQFRMASRDVVEHGHQHEYSMFERDLQSGVHNLENTRRWWGNAGSSLGSSVTNGNTLYSRALVDLVFQNSHFDYQQIPETLRLDHVRILKIRARALQMAALSSILLTTKIRLRRNREALWTKDAERLMSLNLLTTDAARIVSLISSSHNMPDSIKEGLLNFVTRVLPPAIAAASNAANAEQDGVISIQEQTPYSPATARPDRISPDDVFGEQVATYVLKSMREHVFARLSANSTAEKVRASTSAAEVLARAGMPEFVNEVGAMVELLERVRSVDLKAHAKWYDQVACEVQQGFE